MIGINSHEKYNWKTTEYKKYLKILRHIKEVNPAVNALHTEPVDTVKVQCISNGVESTVDMTKEEYEQHEHESWVYFCYMHEQNKIVNSSL